MKRFGTIRQHRESPTDEPRWHASLAVMAALALYITLPPKLTFGPVWIAPLLVAAMLVPLSVLAPSRHKEAPWQRGLSIALIAVLNFFNVMSVAFLVYDLFVVKAAHHSVGGQELLLAGAQIWLTNVLVFALWFWELDGGGPEPRAHASAATEFRDADFLFQQMSLDAARIACAEQAWKPFFLDYLYIAFTNALAFSPADTMPLSRMAKMLMLIESLVSFVTVALILARSIGIIA